MPKFTIDIENNRPLISVIICQDFNRFKQIVNSDFQTIQNSKFIALVDTGATHSTISPEVVQELSLEPIGKSDVMSASHTIEVNKYNITLAILIEELQQVKTETGEVTHGVQMDFSTHDIEVCEMNTHSQGIDMLLGMDILQRCLLVFNGKTFTFSF